MIVSRGRRMKPPLPVGHGQRLCPRGRGRCRVSSYHGLVARPRRAWGRAFSVPLAADALGARGGAAAFGWPGGLRPPGRQTKSRGPEAMPEAMPPAPAFQGASRPAAAPPAGPRNPPIAPLSPAPHQHTLGIIRNRRAPFSLRPLVGACTHFPPCPLRILPLFFDLAVFFFKLPYDFPY